MTEYKIEKNVPIPQPKTGGQFRGLPQVLRGMQIGDSVFERNIATARSASHKASNGSGLKFVVRKEGSGSRIWRVS